MHVYTREYDHASRVPGTDSAASLRHHGESATGVAQGAARDGDSATGVAQGAARDGDSATGVAQGAARDGDSDDSAVIDNSVPWWCVHCSHQDMLRLSAARYRMLQIGVPLEMTCNHCRLCTNVSKTGDAVTCDDVTYE
jgi:hypothetical protein